jgi:hypothetical protein
MRGIEYRSGRPGRLTAPHERAIKFHWEHLMIRCGSPYCSHRIKMQLAVLGRFRGIHFQRRWYHDTACLADALLVQLTRLLLAREDACPRAHRIPIGLLLVNRGSITSAELREGLRLQRRAGMGKLGYWLQQITHLDEDEICAALGQQWGCPVFPLDRQTAPAIAEAAPPTPLLVAAKAVPVFRNLDGHQWHIAFSERIDHTLLYALEEVLECRTVACVASESSVNEALDLFQKRARGIESCFDSVRDPVEMATTICGYAVQIGARQVKLVRAAGYIWAAFFQRGMRRDLLFQVSSRVIPFPRERLRSSRKELGPPADIRRDGVRYAGDGR